MPNPRLPLLLILPATLAAAACDVLGPSCLARREGGPVDAVSGVAPAGGTTSLVMRYEPRGSQNTIEVTWPGAGAPGGPRLWFVATRSACSAFPREVALDPSSPCAVLAEAGQRHDGPLVSSMTVTHGRGNPSILGSPPDYRVWITSEASAPTPFTLDARWSFGPDC